MEKSKLLFIKTGNFKSGTFSKKTASEFSFYSDKIMIRPMGWNRLFNSADIFILKEDIVRITDGFTILGHNTIIETKTSKFWLIFLGDKLQIKQILNDYFMP